MKSKLNFVCETMQSDKYSVSRALASQKMCSTVIWQIVDCKIFGKLIILFIASHYAILHSKPASYMKIYCVYA